MKKHIVITGGNKGIGLAVTARFIEQDYTITVLARDFAAFPYHDKENVQTIRVDLSDPAAVRRTAAQLEGVDILINKAGINGDTSYDTYRDSMRNHVLQVNLFAPVDLITLLAPQFIAKGAGRIINVASQAAEIGHSDIWYGISKAGLVNATKSFASALGPYGVTVNAVAPGPVHTTMLEQFHVEKRIQNLLNRTYMKRMASADDVAEIIYWLATDAPIYFNGETIDLNNGAQKI